MHLFFPDHGHHVCIQLVAFCEGPVDPDTGVGVVVLDEPVMLVPLFGRTRRREVVRKRQPVPLLQLRENTGG